VDGIASPPYALRTPIGRDRLARVKVNNSLPICLSFRPSSLSS
jgi:hypothetical protein